MWNHQKRGDAMTKLTPIFVVERIEPCLDFWVNRLGFAKTAEVPHGDSLGFVILVRGNVEIMYQSRDSIRDDAPALLAGRSDSASPNTTYIGFGGFAVVASNCIVDGVGPAVVKVRSGTCNAPQTSIKDRLFRSGWRT
jgi:hypothetical protein